MPQTFYVTQDEEILSLVGRLRSSTLLENVFVVPKRALILQSVVNLRILAREAEKLGKAVVIVTQDNEGRMLAEKAGITTRVYSEETRSADRQSTPIPAVHGNVAPSRSDAVQHHRADIGSDDFFGAGVPAPSTIVAAPSQETARRPMATGEMKLRIRDNSPKNLTSLNSSVASASVVPPQQWAAARSFDTGVEAIRRHSQEQPTGRILSPQNDMTKVVSSEAGIRQGRLSHVFRNREAGDRERISRVRSSTTPTLPVSGEEHVGSRVRFWFFLFISVSTLSLLGAGAFLFLPKAEIVVTPDSASQNIEMEFDGKKDAIVGEKDVRIRLMQKEMEITVSVETSGDSAGNGEKAKGKITISNEFDSEPQPLVATTRFESSDGKIFRLARGITVPGMSETDGKKVPGVIEADVIADETGEEYNIEPSSFTVPGFKGGPKYAKFSAKSTGKMTGGSVQGESKSRAISASDVRKAKEEAERTFRTSFEESVRSELSENERIMIQSARITMIGTPSYPQIGTAASSFEYVSKWTGEVFAFSEDDLREKSVRFMEGRSEKAAESEIRDISFEYGDATADYEKGLLYIRARMTALLVSKIDTGSLRDAFLGKGSEEIREVLEKYPEIKKIEVNLRPKLFLFSVPKDRDRVTIRVEEP